MDIRDQKPDADHRVNAERALALRIDGLEYAAIATKLGYSDESGPRKAVDRLLSRRESESCTQYRVIETSRLESLMAAHLPAARQGDIDATKAVLNIHDRLAKLHGLDRPQAVAVGVAQMSGVEFANEAARLIASIDALGGGDELRHGLPAVIDGAVVELGTAAVPTAQGPSAQFDEDEDAWPNVGIESMPHTPGVRGPYAGAELNREALQPHGHSDEARLLLDSYLAAIREHTAAELARLESLAVQAENDAEAAVIERTEAQQDVDRLA